MSKCLEKESRLKGSHQVCCVVLIPWCSLPISKFSQRMQRINTIWSDGVLRKFCNACKLLISVLVSTSVNIGVVRVVFVKIYIYHHASFLSIGSDAFDTTWSFRTNTSSDTLPSITRPANTGLFNFQRYLVNEEFLWQDVAADVDLYTHIYMHRAKEVRSCLGM